MTTKTILEHAHTKQEHKHTHITESELNDAYKIFFGTLVSESRLKIIHLLRKEKKNVSEIMQELKMDQTSVSHDLARMKRCGFVICEVEGKFRYYKLNTSIEILMNLIEKHMSNYCAHILHGMKGGHEHGKQ